MMSRRHLEDRLLALLAGNDVPLERAMGAWLHLATCSDCRARLADYRDDRQQLRRDALDLPPGLDWDRLAAEMHANIRLGLEAGQIVEQPSRRRIVQAEPRWRFAAVAASLAFVVVSGWWLNRTSVPLGTQPAASIDANSPKSVVLLPAADASELLPDVAGGTRARSVDAETGQVTITRVYAD